MEPVAVRLRFCHSAWVYSGLTANKVIVPPRTLMISEGALCSSLLKNFLNQFKICGEYRFQDGIRLWTF